MYIKTGSISVKELAKQLDVSIETVRRWLRAGKIRGTFDSRRGGYIIDNDDLADFLMRHPKYCHKFEGPDKQTIDYGAIEELRDITVELMNVNTRLVDYIRMLEKRS